ncbi:hypothetical protein [Nocardioides rubriscoriae]|uniref:hypothetical protein n=1 Tax=Nocardioides rubriscoriae TaxID=642762 RepID=UPI0011DF9C4B|nr:hypothetical protein [Nocardioides rubriscoriae]
MRSDRPALVGDGLTFGPPTTAADRRTVEAVVTSATAPDPADLDVVLSGDRLDEPGVDPAGAAPATAGRAPATTLLDAPDPGVAGPFTIVTSDYELPGVKLAGMRQPIEMVGHVVEPAADQATGPRPLVLFLHGRHGVCYKPGDDDAYSETWPCAGGFEEIPSHLGYDYLQRLLASQGYATVSVRVNGVNAQDYRLPDGGAGARATIVRRHLDHWTSLAAAHQVDLSQVVLVGHSRGGEGVDRASIQVPLTAPYRIVGQVLLAPTDFASHTAPYVPTVTVLPYCDGDVSDLQGQKFTDVGRDLVAGDTSLKSSVLVMGANHNFFNTEWTPATAAAPSSDDWFGPADQPCGRRHPGRLSARGQRAVGKAYVAGAVHLFTGDGAYLPLFDGSHVTIASIGTADVRSHALGAGRDVRRPGLEATPTLATGGAETRLCSGVTSWDAGPVGICGGGLQVTAPHFVPQGEGQPSRRFLELAWTRAGGVGGLRFDAPLDLTDDRLELRTIVDSRRGAVDLRVRVTDGAGASAVLTPEGGTRVAPLLVSPEVTKLWAQPLLVDASGASGVDLADVVSVELLADSPRGRVWVAEVAAAPAGLVPVPSTRLPVVDVGELRVDEGDPARTGPRASTVRSARIPFTITGPVTRPGQLVVQTVGQEIGRPQRFTVDVAPGQTSGSIPVRYSVDRLADFRLTTAVTVWSVRGLATDDYVGALTVVDDDPQPELRITVPRQVREGQPIVVGVRNVGGAADYDLSAYLETRRGPGTDLTGADVPARFLAGFGEELDPALPLWKLGVYVFDSIRPGARATTLVVPTRRDGVREGTETLTIRVNADGERLRRTVEVLDAG